MEVLARSVLVVTIFFIGYVALYQLTMWIARAIYRRRKDQEIRDILNRQQSGRKWSGR